MVGALAHGLVLGGLFLGHREPSPTVVPAPPILLELVPPPKPPPPPLPSPPAPADAPQGGAEPAPVQAPPQAATATPEKAASSPRPRAAPPARVRPVPPQPDSPPAPSGPVEAPPAPLPVVGPAQLAGALTAGSGSGAGGSGSGAGTGQGGGAGDGCDMARRLQRALRGNARLQAEIARAHRAAEAGPGAVLVWNGDWLRDPSQEGKGLAGVRQAIAVEVAFSPRACQAEPVRGLVLLTLSDTPGAPRVALGTGRWTWGDLLERRR